MNRCFNKQDSQRNLRRTLPELSAWYGGKSLKVIAICRKIKYNKGLDLLWITKEQMKNVRMENAVVHRLK